MKTPRPITKADARQHPALSPLGAHLPEKRPNVDPKPLLIYLSLQRPAGPPTGRPLSKPLKTGYINRCMGTFRLALKFLAQGNFEAGKHEILSAIGVQTPPSDYQRWRELHRITPADRRRMAQQIDAWPTHPRFSIISTEAPDLKTQIYPLPEICNLAHATGDFLCFLSPGDELAEHALFRFAEAIIADPTRDIIYADEDRLSQTGEHRSPFFKPDWSPEYFLAWMYTGSGAFYRRELVQKIGGIRPEFGDATEYDLMLRLIAAGAKCITFPMC